MIQINQRPLKCRATRQMNELPSSINLSTGSRSEEMRLLPPPLSAHFSIPGRDHPQECTVSPVRTQYAVEKYRRTEKRFKSHKTFDSKLPP